MPEPLADQALTALADAIASMATILRSPTQTQLFAHASDDKRVPRDGRDRLLPFTTLRIFTALPIATTPNRVAAQALTDAPTVAAAYEQDRKVSGALLWPAIDPETDEPHDGAGLPRRGWEIEGFVIDVFSVAPGMLIGVDETGRPKVSTNFEFAYRASPSI